MIKVTVLGAGAAPGVPSLSCGWGDCNPENAKNLRTRTSTYYDFNGTAILIDTSPDLRLQLIRHQIKRLDGVLYTHTHADHLHGIDDLREINRINNNSLNFYAKGDVVETICQRFPYLIASPGCITRLFLSITSKSRPFVSSDIMRRVPVMSLTTANLCT